MALAAVSTSRKLAAAIAASAGEKPIQAAKSLQVVENRVAPAPRATMQPRRRAA
jgi:hypothetical protein